MNSIPNELYESARIDGCNDFRCFFRIALPLSAPIIAVMVLYFAVASWNSYFQALIYINKAEKFPLQLVLRNILIFGQMMLMNQETFGNLSQEEQLYIIQRARMAEAMKYAVVYIASAPLLIAYPFVQKHFVKGIMIGALKG
jgi:putative aldouronate transport system permease protein